MKQQSEIAMITSRKKKPHINEQKKFFNEVAMLINELDPIRNEEMCEDVFVIAVMRLAVEDYKMELDDFVSAICCGELLDGGRQEGEEQCYLHRANFRQKLFHPGYVADKANLLFLWRCLLQLCTCHYGKPETEAKLVNCRFKLVPTMTDYAKFVGDFLHNGLGSVDVARDVLATPARPILKNAPPATPITIRKRRADTEQYEQQQIHYIMRQLFNIFPLLEMDNIGKNHWHDLAFSVLANPTVTLREQFLQELVVSLMFYHYPDDEQTEQALRCFCDAINNIVTRNLQTDQQITDHQLRSPSFLSTSSRDSLHLNPMAKLDEPIRIRCLSIFTAMLRSARFMRSNVELLGLYDALITKDSLFATSAEERFMVYRCLTWRCMFCETYAVTFMPVIWHALQLHHGHGLLPYLDMIGDLVRFYGYTKIASWYVKSLDEVQVVEDSFLVEEEEERAVAEGRSTQMTQSNTSQEDNEDVDTERDDETAQDQRKLEILNKYIHYARHTQLEPQVALHATEQLCGWLLCGGLRIGSDESVKALTNLLLVMFNEKSCDLVPAAHECLSRFFPCFVSVSRRHQQLLIRSFMAAFTLLQTMNLALLEEARCIDTVKMAMCVQQFTSFSVLAERAVQRRLGTVHSEFAQKILEMVRDNPEELFAAIYLRLLPTFDPVEQQETLQNLLMLCTDTIKHFEELHEGGAAGKLINLRAYLRILTKRADILR